MKQENIKIAIKEAEYQRSQSNLAKAYQIYLEILIEYLSSQNDFNKFSALIMTVIHSLVDLTILFGDLEETENILAFAVRKYQEVENFSMAYFTHLKRIDLAIDRSDNLAKKLLHQLYSQIGDIENLDISPLGLIKWEADCFRVQTDTQEKTVLFAYLYLVMGKLLSSLGQYEKSIIMLERGLFYTGEKTPSIARQADLSIQFAIASAYLEKGDLKLAQEKLKYLWDEFNQFEQPEALVRYLELDGKIHLLHGSLGQALNNFEKVKNICQNFCKGTSFFYPGLQATINLAHLLISLNQTNLARQHLKEALKAAKILKNAKLIRQISLLIQLAKARSTSLASEHPDAVSQMQGKSKNNYSKKIKKSKDDCFYLFYSSNYLAKFEDRVLNFHLLLSHLDLEKANILLSNIQESFLLSDSKLIKIKINILEAILSYYQARENNNDLKNIYEVALNLERICSELLKLGLKLELWQTQRFLSWCLSRLENSKLKKLFIGKEKIKVKHQIIIQENQKLLEEITNSLPLEAQAIYSLNKWTSDEESLAVDINSLQKLNNQIKENFIFLRPWKYWLNKLQLHDLLQRIEYYKDLVVKKNVETNKFYANKSLDTSLFFRLITHPINRITLFFLVLPDRILLVRIGWLLFDFQVLYHTRKKLRDLVQLWHKKMQTVSKKRDFLISQYFGKIRDLEDENDLLMNEFKNETKEISKEIAKLLNFSSLLNDLPKRIKAITIVPDDILHGFPFATIIHRDRYLIEDYSLSISYQTNHIKLSNYIPSKEKKALVIGVSQPASLGKMNFQSLPGVKAEIKKIENWLNQLGFPRKILENNYQKEKHQEPSKQAVIQNLTSSTLVHIACHGIFEYNRPDRSGLILVSNSEVEILSFKELSNLDLTQLSHVTLSSCWAADHYILPGRWIISLPETLWRSGVESILSCLWQVSDTVAVAFMADFYENLKKFPRDKALQRTQLKCLKNQLNDCHDQIDNPFFWAGFNLYGDYFYLSSVVNRKVLFRYLYTTLTPREKLDSSEQSS